MKKNNKAIRLALLGITACMLSSVTVSAATGPYTSYTYDSYGNAVESAELYEPEAVYTGNSFLEQDESVTVKTMLQPTDMYAADNNCLYILDAGNSRILVLDKNMNYLRTVNVTIDGAVQEFKKAKGIFVDYEEKIYIADAGGKRVLCADSNGRVFHVIDHVDSEQFGDGVEFLPQKLVMDNAGNLYVQSTGTYSGLVVFDTDFEFNGFYGADLVQTTAEALSDFFWKQFMTETQREAMANYVPLEIQNFDVTEKGFLYTVTPSRKLEGQQVKTEIDSIRYLNPKGTDRLVNKMSKNAWKALEADARSLNFVDICYDETGFINVVDSNHGKIYQFDTNMNLITAFGALGDYTGTFSEPVAIEILNNKLLVLDKTKANLTAFSLTETGEKVHHALGLYHEGKYTEAIEPWMEVIEENVNFELAYIGVGNALYNLKDYKGAMEYYELGRDSEKYSEAYTGYRNEVLRSNMGWIFIVVVVLCVGIVIYNNKTADRPIKSYRTRDRSKYELPFHCMFHPGDGFDDLKFNRKTSLFMSIVILFSMVVMFIVQQRFTGIQIQMLDAERINIFKTLFVTVGVVFLFTVANVAFCVLVDGKATMKDVWIVTNYALLPYICTGYIQVILSNVMSQDEAVFLEILTVVGILWSLIILIAGFMTFHQFGIGKTLFSLFITAVAMVLIIFLIFLCYNLFTQMAGTVTTILNEFIFRLRLQG